MRSSIPWFAFLVGCHGADGDTGTTPSGTDGTGLSTTETGTPPGTTPTTPTTDTGQPPPPPRTLLERLEVHDLSVPDGVSAGVTSWRIWGTSSLRIAPVFTVPLADCRTLVGYSTAQGARVAVVAADDTLVGTLPIGAGMELRGLAAEPDGHFGALLWNPSTERIFVDRFDGAGQRVWSTELLNADNHPDDFGIGDSRLAFGGGRYGAYYHTHSDSGHEGDTLKWVDVGGSPSTGWSWGCSHSMSALLRYHPGTGDFLPACVTDCYPGTSGDFGTNSIGGIYLEHDRAKVMDVDAECNGHVAAELGSLTPTSTGWVMVFNAHQEPATRGTGSYRPGSMDQDIGITTIDGNGRPGPVQWLTSSDGVDEDDATVARWSPAETGDEQLLVGWHSGSSWQLVRLGASGLLEGPVDLGGTARWGRRDDPFRVDAAGDVVWAWFDDPGSTTLHLARLDAGHTCTPP
ncbi:MAG: hypothetical protein H6735_25395 [Alphaproteobacteria bacterium]|nr:hypothetical protein [Alphaproteobacteria bacterium]